ncbi:MAG TPA: Ig-like domain-containing protein [Candidatus Solibacter sp.]|nr:Ig-like domain-containing protein [Candidatus Solibacter sp.]
MAGQPLVWPQGLITYYTDQGDLSPILPNADANSFVADAFSQWTSVPTAAIAASSGGQLSEDVNGTNVIVSANGISVPSDIQSTATTTPVGVVYDYDGSVTDALIGSGAGDSSQCFFNAVYGGDDNYSPSGTYLHALIVINGQCALESSQLVDVEYRLVRVIGSVFGLGWSQVNPNVLTGNPQPTGDDYAGFPVMHFKDSWNCVPITKCYPNPYQLAADDAAAMSRLYPVNSQNQSSFNGKQISSAVTARIHGSVWFTGSSGNAIQPMQGVNVVARWIDPTTKQPSRRYAASCVSGFLFTGNAGNAITGFNDALGDPYSEWGSNSTSVEGFFDLGNLPLPNGSPAQYQLSVEPLDPTWAAGVGSYAPLLVTPSGLGQSITISVSAGQDVEQDIMMTGSAQALAGSASTWIAPASTPLTGNWQGSISGYGASPYFLLPAQGNRTLSVAITSLDEYGSTSESKAQPVIGMWAASDPEGTPPPAFTPSAFNTSSFGLTRLDAQIAASTNFLIGVADARGDGRPDYRYQAYVLYGDSAAPPRLSVSGGPVTLLGTGFAPGLNVSVGNNGVTPLAVNAGQMILAAPAFADGPQSITISDPVTGASSVMTNVLTYGAASTDNLLLLSSVNPSTPVGTQAPNPMTVRAVAADGVTPVAGATIAWSASNGLQLSACGGVSSCKVTTDESGLASSWLTPASVGTASVTATLAPGAYSTSPSVTTTLSSAESNSDIGVVSPLIWIAQGATVSTPLTARVLSLGVPQVNAKVNFTVVTGIGALSAASAPTNSNGYASVTLSVTQFASLVQISACVAPANAPCQAFYANPVPLASLNLSPISGAGQISTASFQPLVMRVTDSSSPPNSVLGAQVAFQTTVFRPGGSGSGGGGGETNSGNPGMPVILSVSQSGAVSDINGLVSISPSSGGFSAPLEVNVAATAGTTAALSDLLELLPAPASGSDSLGREQPVAPIERPVWPGGERVMEVVQQ